MINWGLNGRFTLSPKVALHFLQKCETTFTFTWMETSSGSVKRSKFINMSWCRQQALNTRLELGVMCRQLKAMCCSFCNMLLHMCRFPADKQHDFWVAVSGCWERLNVRVHAVSDFTLCLKEEVRVFVSSGLGYLSVCFFFHSGTRGDSFEVCGPPTTWLLLLR